MTSCSILHSNLNNFRCAEKYCDINVRVQNSNFWCHRAVLASVSEYFDALFSGGFKEITAQETTLHDIDDEAFAEIIKSVYMGQKCNITVSNVHSLLRASLFLKIHSVEKNCAEFLMKNISLIRDHVEIFILSRAVNMTALVDTLGQYIVANFKSFYDDSSFLEMPFDDLKLILNKWVQDKLPFKYENLLLNLLIHWVHYAPESRRKYFKQLVEVVNFERISAKYITFMLKYFKNLVEVSGFEETSTKKVAYMIKVENELNCDSSFRKWYNIQDSKNRLLLKEKIAKYFAENEQFYDNRQDMMPISIQDPYCYENELGLHVYVEYEKYPPTDGICSTNRQRCKNAKILSMNKYQPDWFLSNETNAWYRCSERSTVTNKPASLLYCLEIFQDNCVNDSENFRQTFCTYSSIDMGLPSSVLAPPPFSVKRNPLMCTMNDDIYLQTSCEHRSYETLANTIFSLEEIRRGFYHYNCAVDKWFPVCERQSGQRCSCLATDDNLIYSIGGKTDGSSKTYSNLVQAFDYRCANWIGLQSTRLEQDYKSISCTLNGKIYVSNGYQIEVFDFLAGKWEHLKSPIFSPGRKGFKHVKILPYENMLWVIADPEHDWKKKYQIATYNLVSQEWYISETINDTILNFMPNEKSWNICSWRIKDVILFRPNTAKHKQI